MPSGPPRGPLFYVIYVIFDDLRPSFLRYILVRFRLRARVRSWCLAMFEAFILKFGSPRFLKPWVAAGGREAIRILKN